MKKYIFGFLVLVIAAAWYFSPSLETIVKKVVNKYGSEITGTEVNLQGFKLSLTKGEGEISEITVANPKNYSAPYIFSLGDIFVKVDLKSLASDTIVIEKIAINKPVITYEMLSLTQNNISQIQKNIAANTASKDAQASQAKEEAPKDEASSKKVVIKELVVANGEIQAIANINGKANDLKVKLPQIVMRNIGEEKKGESIASSITKILNNILKTASKTVVESQLGDLRSVADENLNKVVGGVKDRVKELGIFGK